MGVVVVEMGSVLMFLYFFSGGGFCVFEEDVVLGFEGYYE